MVGGFVNYGQSLFKVSRSGLNLLSRGNKVNRSRTDFFGEGVVNYWNNLPSSVRLSSSVDICSNVTWRHIRLEA